ncbi:hypothetical protein ACG2F4_19350 [Halalkalibaculum sp. DA3122]|uniref:hypothetical protein n=1 Tax=Halalkalibaculum sp. DA3122 TaxID=3373607 RepID=UPI0037542546
MKKETVQGGEQRLHPGYHSSRETGGHARTISRFLLAIAERVQANKSPAGDFFGSFFHR